MPLKTLKHHYYLTKHDLEVRNERFVLLFFTEFCFSNASKSLAKLRNLRPKTPNIDKDWFNDKTEKWVCPLTNERLKKTKKIKDEAKTVMSRGEASNSSELQCSWPLHPAVTSCEELSSPSLEFASTGDRVKRRSCHGSGDR